MEFTHILEQMNETGFTVFDPSKRLFWGNILGALIFLCLVPGQGKRLRFKTLFAKVTWLHPSSLADMKIILLNSILRALLFTGSIFSATAIAAGISLLLTYIFGGKPDLHWNPTIAAGLFAITLFLADDFARFYVHTLQHRSSYLWLFHQTHHSALVLTPLTLLRTHPVEIVIARVRNALTYGVVTGVFFYLLGTDLSVWDILGTEVLGFVFNFLGANLRHSQVWLNFGALEPYLISPAAHQVHHSIEVEHYDKNFGVCLSIWDRIWKTHLDPRQLSSQPAFGLIDSPLSDAKQSVWTLYIQPFRELMTKLSAPLK